MSTEISNLTSQNDHVYDSTPLINDGDFRLLSLEPGDNDSELCCTLRVAVLRGTVSKAGLPEDLRSVHSPGYEALSYAWGDTARTLPLKCSGTTLQITTNLHAALKKLRLLERPRSLWVDAICINQNRTSERNSQVRRMQDIYAGASQVVVWLGLSAVEEPFKFVSRLITPMLGDPNISLFSFPESAEQGAEEGLFENEYLVRKWVIQEWVFASSIKLLKSTGEYDLRLKRPGEKTEVPEDEDTGTGIVISRLTMRHALMTSTTNYSEAAGIGMQNIATMLLLWAQSQQEHTSMSLSTILRRTSSYRTSYMLDHIIAVSNLANDLDESERKYIIDYELSPDELVMRTAVLIMRKDGLQFLQDAIGPDISWRSRSINRDGLIPSWVPRHLFRSELWDTLDLSSGKGSFLAPPQLVNDQIQIRGRSVGVISSLTKISHRHAVLSIAETQQRFREWQAFLDGLRALGKNSHQLFWELLLTFVTDEDSRGASALKMGYHDLLVETIFDNVLQLGIPQLKTMSPSSIQSLMWGLVTSLNRYSLCCTNTDRLGFAIEQAQCGDTVFVCGEGQLHSLIIRAKDNGGHSVLGNARFVHAGLERAIKGESELHEILVS